MCKCENKMLQISFVFKILYSKQNHGKISSNEKLVLIYHLDNLLTGKS